MTSLVLGDDHGVFLDAMAAVLEKRGYTVTVSHTVTGTLQALRQRKPDICLLNRYIAGADSIEVIGEMLDASPATKILVLTANPGTDGVFRALQSGAAGYLHKTRGVAAVFAAIDRVRRGEVVVDMPRVMAGRRPQRRDDPHRLADYLSHRERDCLGLMVDGLDTSAMAAELGVSPGTVRTHVQGVLTKLGVHSRVEAAALAVRYRLLGTDQTGAALGLWRAETPQQLGGSGRPGHTAPDNPRSRHLSRWTLRDRPPAPASTRDRRHVRAHGPPDHGFGHRNPM